MERCVLLNQIYSGCSSLSQNNRQASLRGMSKQPGFGGSDINQLDSDMDNAHCICQLTL